MPQRATGRWNRDAGECRGEIVYSGQGCWAECHVHNWQGEPVGTTGQADAQMEAHERQMFEARKGGFRYVRGQFE